MLRSKELPKLGELEPFQHAVAGHAGSQSDSTGELFIKPCTQAEIDFYESAQRRHPEFAKLMPLLVGNLHDQQQPVDAVAGIITDAGIVNTEGDIAAAITEQIAQVASTAEASTAAAAVATAAAEPQSTSAPASALEATAAWVPTRGKRIKTDKFVVLDNALYGYTKANIMDAKLGSRLWADDAPMEKKKRFDQITKTTTHGNFGFRIAGMKVYHGTEDESQWDEDGYKIYDKEYGRVSVNDDNIHEAIGKFVFNKAAGVDQDLGKAVCAAFARDLQHIEDVLKRHESRMYSSSLLFLFEGDGKALRRAIEANNEAVDTAEEVKYGERTNQRVDSGIVLEEDDDELDDDCSLSMSLSSLPKIYTIRLIDFAHAEWTPGLGPDTNVLKGVESLKAIFEKLAT